MGRLVRFVILLAVVGIGMVLGHQGLVLGARGGLGDGVADMARASCGACHGG